jgi:ribosome maturation factor RimP
MQQDIEAICSGFTAIAAFSDIEILKSTIRRERGTFYISLVIDRAAGIGTEVCEAVARHIERRLEALPPPVPLFTLEVASAGLARPLLTPDHYRRFQGREINVITTLRIRNRTEFTGTIAEVADNAVTIEDKYIGSTPLPYQAIKRANLVYHPEDDLKKSKSR